MDFRSQLINFPGGAEREHFIKQFGHSELHFRSLLEIALYDKDPLAWRAAWLLDGSDEQYPGSAAIHISTVVQQLPQLESKGSLRSMLRLLCRYEIKEEDQGLLIDLCFGYMVSEIYPVAVKVHAMQVIYNHVLLYPELKGELVSVLEDQIANNSVGFKSRANRIIRQLEK